MESSISVDFAPLPTNQHHLTIFLKTFCIYIVVIQRFTFLVSLKLRVHEKLPSKFWVIPQFEKKNHTVYNIYIFSQTLRRTRPLAWLFLCRILSSLSGFSWIGSIAEKYSYSCLVQWPAVRTCSQMWPVGEWPRIYITWLLLIFVDKNIRGFSLISKLIFG